MDGKEDCENGSDECPAFLDDAIASSRSQLSSNLIITISLWIMSLVGVIGNITVFVYTVGRLVRVRHGTHSSIKRANFILILNLNVADFFTSLYLLVIGSKNAAYSGIYCYKDLEWRTSNTCNFLGAFVVFSTEASLLMLILMTSQRLYTSIDSLKRTSIRLKLVFVGVVMMWCVSALIAALPLVLPHLFIERYWVQSKYFNLPLVELPVFNEFFRNLVLITEPSNTTALEPNFNFRSFLETNYPQFRIQADYGYFNENSFCIPHFYASFGDKGWYYPTLMVIINMIAFIYVIVAYIYIYKITTRDFGRNDQDLSSMRTLQKRITKLVLTNVAIWFPICIASYVQLGIHMEYPPIVFIVTAVYLFPLNSVLNPLLYSDVFEKAIQKLRILAIKAVQTMLYSKNGNDHPIEMSSNI